MHVNFVISFKIDISVNILYRTQKLRTQKFYST